MRNLVAPPPSTHCEQCDGELLLKLIKPGDPVFDKAIRKLAQGADVLIYDAQYLPEEYEARKRGWGHSHWREGISIAQQSEVKHLVLFHHDPDHSDDRIDQIVEEARQYFPRVTAASEGLAFEL